MFADKKKKKMNCTIIKETIRIDEYLAHKGLQPSKVTANGIWYNSPITGETHPSFQVSPNGRFFHDWSSGAKGTIIDLSLSLYPGSLIHDAIIDITSNSNINISQSLNSIRYIVPMFEIQIKESKAPPPR